MSCQFNIYNPIAWTLFPNFNMNSNFLGLETQLEKNKIGALNDDVRYSVKTKSFSQMEPKFSRREEFLENQNKVEEKIYDITKVD